MWYNGQSRSCYGTVRGFSLEGSPSNGECIELRHYKKSFWRCGNRQAYHFKIESDDIGINVRDNGVHSCIGGGGAGGSDGSVIIGGGPGGPPIP